MKVEIPHITKKDLYEKSGHWDKFKDELFRITTREGHLFAMKPMNCPHHTQIYARRAWSYRELPQRYANTTMVYRDEQSGELGGLLRVRSITQDDAHVFCRITQAEDEIKKIWDIIETFYGTFGITLRLRISLHDPKHKENYLGNPKSWKEAEGILRTIATSRNMEFSEAPGEAAFYGPKLDFIGTDSLGRTTQVATIQLDLNMPERFDLSCTNEKGEPERIVMIHAAIMGSIERFLSLAIEHFAGAFPLWLAPEQVRILAVSDKFAGYAKQIEEKLLKADIRVVRPEASDTLGKRIREGELMKIPYLVIVGEQEETKGTVSIRRFGKGQTADIPLDTFLRDLNGEIEQKAR
jgi:threonyl-tRNA synthetase